MKVRVVITGYAVVSFRSVLQLTKEEAEAFIAEGPNSWGCNIDASDAMEIQEITSVNAVIKEKQ
jgi:hypothetical protein